MSAAVNSKSRLWTALTLTGVALIAASLLLFAALNYRDSARLKSDSLIVSRIEALIPPLEIGVPDSRADKDDAMPSVDIDGVGYIGYLRLPSLSMIVPVSDGAEGSGVIWYSGNVPASSLIISTSDRLYQSLADLGVGDSLTFVDVRGNVWDMRIWKELRLHSDSHIEPVDDADMTIAVRCRDAVILIGCRDDI